MDSGPTAAPRDEQPGSPGGEEQMDGEFNPALHSWILVPENEEALAPSTPGTPLVRAVETPLATNGVDSLTIASGEGEDDGTAALPEAVANSVSPPLSPVISHRSPPNCWSGLPSMTLSNSLMEEGEAVAAMVMTEILSGAFQISSPSNGDSSPLTLRLVRDIGDELPLCRAASSVSEDILYTDCVDSNLTETHCSGRSRGPSYTSCEGDGMILSRPLTWARYISAQPLALVAVLIASHAAALFLGLAIGRGTPGQERRIPTEYILTRRFSSGPYGYHARLCIPT